ncbi:MAG TPA: glycerol kinase GlpK [Bryobacterales bacterium]|nr:glycerol kinase GlpK [Bryobacterales bacterium]
MYILALDEGTTSARAIVFDRNARALAMESAPIECHYPNPGWVEQDAEQIWQAQFHAARRALDRTGIPAAHLTAIGITNQRETTIVWDRKTGVPVAPAIVWQCRRTADFCRSLAAAGHAPAIAARTGLVIDAYFSASKIRWILDHTASLRERAEAGELAFGTVDSWLIHQLTGGRVHVADRSNASRTMLLNLDGTWDTQMLELFGVPAAMLPRVAGSAEIVGATDAPLFGAEVPIAGIAGDQQAALVGQACFRPGLSKNTYGTGCFFLMHTGNRPVHSQNRLLTTLAASPGRSPEYALEGSVFVAGAAVQWLRDSLGIIKTSDETASLAASVPDSGGVYFVPAFVGLGAPHWNATARGTISGITRATTAAHLVRATLEAIAYQTRELVEAMEADAGSPLTELRADGGAAANDFLMQFQADMLGRPVVRPANIETTALGAAFLAGLATRVWSGIEEIEGFWRVDRRFEPQMPAPRREDLFGNWKRAVTACCAAS